MIGKEILRRGKCQGQFLYIISTQAIHHFRKRNKLSMYIVKVLNTLKDSNTSLSFHAKFEVRDRVISGVRKLEKIKIPGAETAKKN